MRATVMRKKKLVVGDIPTPEPGPGEVLVKTLACGICGSDLHALKHAEKLVEGRDAPAARSCMDLARDIVMGHEFCAEIVDYGPGATKALQGRHARVLACRVAAAAERRRNGRLLERQSRRLRRVHAADRGAAARGAERPLDRARRAHRADGGRLHAVEKARLENDDVPLVIGCGPVGLAVIAALKLKARGRSSPRTSRRAGASSRWRWAPTSSSTPRRSRRTRAGGSGAWDDPAAGAPSFRHGSPGPPLRPAVIFECVGVPGVIDKIMTTAPPRGAHRRGRRVHGARLTSSRCSASTRN